MLKISDVNPYIRRAMHSVIRANHTINRRIIFDYELIYVAGGEFILRYDEVDYRCQEGQFLFLRPGIPHSFTNSDVDLVQPHIHFDITHLDNSVQVPISFKDFDSMTEQEKSWIRQDVFADYPQVPLVSFSDKEKALSLFYEIVGEHDDQALTRKAKLMSLLEWLINDNFPHVFHQESPAYRIESQVKDYIDAGQGITAKLDDLAKQFNYSKYYLDRCFRNRYGVGIMAYRNEKRMHVAKDMLKSKTVSEVSESLGFSSIYVFSRAFKNYFGLSPTGVKKQINDQS